MERPGPGQELLRGRSEEIGRRAQSLAQRLLARHPAHIDSHTAEIVASRERELAIQKYLERRKAGLANDLYSKEPGITLYLTEEGKEEIVKVGKEKKFDVYFKQYVEMAPGTVLTEFPTGVFAASPPSLFFAAETVVAKKRLTEKGKKRFTLQNESVVRVEGKHGELWQNPHYNWDGSKKRLTS